MAYVFQPARYELNRQIKKFASALSGRILDVGSGSVGRYKSLLRFDEYVKLDIEGVENVDAKGAADALPFPDASFDSIICTQVLGDVYPVAKAFSEFHRVLKPGGSAMITEALFDSLHDEPHDYWRFTAHSLRRLAEEAGFVVETLEQRGGFWSVRAQMLIRYFINHFDIYHRWYCPIFSFFAKAYGVAMIFLDRIDTSPANRIFAHGYLLVVRKKK